MAAPRESQTRCASALVLLVQPLGLFVCALDGVGAAGINATGRHALAQCLPPPDGDENRQARGALGRLFAGRGPGHDFDRR